MYNAYLFNSIALCDRLWTREISFSLYLYVKIKEVGANVYSV